MQNAKGDSLSGMSGDRDAKTHDAVVAELASAIEHIRKSRRLVESAIIGGVAAEEPAADIIVLDDVTPGYERVDAALQKCEAGLNATLRLLQAP